jgi:hypothetical protein
MSCRVPQTAVFCGGSIAARADRDAGPYMIFPSCWPVGWYGSWPARAPVTAPIAVVAGCAGANGPIPTHDVAKPSAVLAEHLVDLLHKPVFRGGLCSGPPPPCG